MTEDQNKLKEQLAIKDGQVKDLQKKLQVLKTAVLEEMKKTKSLEATNANMKSQLSQLEQIINEKEKEIIKLNTETLEMQNALSLERNNKNNSSVTNIIGNIFQKEGDPLSQIEIKKLQQQIADLKAEKEKGEKAYSEYKEKTQKQIGEDEQTIKKLQAELLLKEKTLDEANKQLADDNKRLEIMANSLKEYDTDKVRLYSQMSTTDEENEKIKNENTALKKEISDKNELMTEWKEKVKKFTEENLLLTRSLEKIKWAFLTERSLIKRYMCEKGESSIKCELSFGRTEDDEYVMLYKEEKKNQQDIYKLEDIEYIKGINDGKKLPNGFSKVEISILRSGNSDKLQVQGNDEVMQEMIKTYQEYFNIAMKMKNDFNF